MNRTAAWLALAVVLAVGVDALGDLTQDRPDHPEDGSRSEIVLAVRTRSAEDSEHAARRLWAACEATIDNRLLDPGLVAVGDGRWLAVTEPAVGPRSWRRLQGCLEDLTLHRVLGQIVSKQDRPAAP